MEIFPSGFEKKWKYLLTEKKTEFRFNGKNAIQFMEFSSRKYFSHNLKRKWKYDSLSVTGSTIDNNSRIKKKFLTKK